MDRNGMLGLVGAGGLLAVGGVITLVVSQLTLLGIAMIIAGAGVGAAGVVRLRRAPTSPPAHEQLVGGIALSLVFVLLGLVGLLGGEGTVTSYVFTVGGLGLLILSVVTYLRARNASPD